MKKEYQLLKEISEIQGISGDEKEVSQLIARELKSEKTIIKHDNLGSTIVYQNGDPEQPTILFTAHMDEIGWMISEVLECGMLRITPIGGWWNHVVLAQQMIVKTRLGKKYFGVIGAQPPHGMSAEMRNKVLETSALYLDMGVTDKKMIEELGIQIGDTVTPYQEFRVLNDGVTLLGKAWDDRICVAVGIEALKQLENIDHAANVVFAGSVQEEVGCRGAKTCSYFVKPDIAIALDVTMSYDLPGSPSLPTKLGAGIALSLKDGSVIAHRGLFDFVEEIAKKHNIKYTYDMLSAGGTDSGEMHKQFDGVINMTLSIPCRYFHSHVSLINYNDYLEAVKLVVEISKAINKETIEKLKASKFE
ncbi:MAG: M42 family metallopeptidase [Bacilli bacterium]